MLLLRMIRKELKEQVKKQFRVCVSVFAESDPLLCVSLCSPDDTQKSIINDKFNNIQESVM